jgi:predicted nuclease of predicted toxin-antitoxin system
MKVLIDMNLSPRWQKFLTEAGLQAAHWSELGTRNGREASIQIPVDEAVALADLGCGSR